MKGTHELESACSPIPKGKQPTHARPKDTFPTALYVIADDFCQSHRPKKRLGLKASLSESEVLALAIFARFSRFVSERDFYRYAESNLRDLQHMRDLSFTCCAFNISSVKHLIAQLRAPRYSRVSKG